MIFGNRKAALKLYNAINHSNYQNPEDLEITTIEGAIYMGVKNDLSFLIDSVMNLYEAQSTRNPNMPLRGLIYFARVYQGYVEKRELDLYSAQPYQNPIAAVYCDLELIRRKNRTAGIPYSATHLRRSRTVIAWNVWPRF